MAEFTTTPDFVFEETIEHHTLLSEFENGSEQRRNKWSQDKRKFSCVFKNRTKSEFETVRDFIIARKGAYESFTFTNPNDSTSYTVRLDGDTFAAQNKAFNLYDFDLKFIEVL
jgi:hypothetical protein